MGAQHNNASDEFYRDALFEQVNDQDARRDELNAAEQIVDFAAKQTNSCEMETRYFVYVFLYRSLALVDDS